MLGKEAIALDPPQYKEVVARFPPNSCIGQTGLYNHHEFMKQLLSISGGNPNVWAVKELVWEQDSLCRHHATGIRKDLGKPTARSAPRQKADMEVGDVFDAPFLSGVAEKTAAKAAGKAAAESSADEFEDVSDGFGMQLEVGDPDFEASGEDSDKSEAQAEPACASGARVTEPAAPAGDRASRADEGASRGPQIKTVATDFSLIQRALGRRLRVSQFPPLLSPASVAVNMRACWIFLISG